MATRQRLSKQGGLSKRNGIRAGALKASIFTLNGGTLHCRRRLRLFSTV
jgi:hypothetical protein